MLLELRKHRVNLIPAHQYLARLEPQMPEEILKNMGTMITVRVGARDAELLAQEFQPEILPLDLTRLPTTTSI